jgi:hypothetical protein
MKFTVVGRAVYRQRVSDTKDIADKMSATVERVQVLGFWGRWT